MSRVDTAIKAAATITVVGLAGIAGAISYSHMTELAHLHGETGWRAHMFPLSVDGIEIVASLVLLADKRAGRRSDRLPWAALVAGTGASFAANMAVGGADWIGRAVSGWPAFALLIAIKLLFGLLEHPTRNSSCPDAQPLVPDGGRTTAIEHGTARTDEPGTSSMPPVHHKPQLDDGHRTQSVDGPGLGRADGAALEAAARAVRTALSDEGIPLTRDALAARLRDAGHTVSNSRASDLVKRLRANALTANVSVPTTAENGARERPIPACEIRLRGRRSIT